MAQCTDPAVGYILSSWRYDLSGSSPAVRGDLEQHFLDCKGCRTRQRLHRTIDVALTGLATASVGLFLLAIAVIHRVEPLRTWVVALHLRQFEFPLTLQDFAIAGLLASVLAWLLVMLVTPAPAYISEVASTQAREIRNRGWRKAA